MGNKDQHLKALCEWGPTSVLKHRMGAEADPALAHREPREWRKAFYVHQHQRGQDTMIKKLLAAVSVVGMTSGAAWAQSYIPVSPPPAAVAPPSVGVPGSTTSTTDHLADYRPLDANGNEIERKDSYREGADGSSESHTTTMTDPDGGTPKTRSKTETKQE